MTNQNNTQQNVTDWTTQEIESLGTHTGEVFEKLPALKLVENKITSLTIDFTKPFNTYDALDMKNEPVKKAIIPIFIENDKKELVKMNWWLNKKNPIYKKLLEMGKGKPTLNVKVVQTGNQKNTKYAIVE